MLGKICNGTESGDKSDDNLTLQPLIIEVKIGKISSGDESNSWPMSTDMSEDIYDRIQYHPIINRRYARFKVRYHIKQRREEWKW